MSIYAVYAYAGTDGLARTTPSNTLNWTGAWSATTEYIAATRDSVQFGANKYITVFDNFGVDPSVVLPSNSLPHNRPNPFSLLQIVVPGLEPPFPSGSGTVLVDNTLAYTALQTAWLGTAAAAAAITLANQAFVLAEAGTTGGSGPDDDSLAFTALTTAWAGTAAAAAANSAAVVAQNEAAAAISLANQAIIVGEAGTKLAFTALQTAWNGTAAASAAITLANQALTTAFVGTTLANLNTTWIGTLNAEAAAAITLANQALALSWAGTNAITLANKALVLAWIGTNAGTGSSGTITSGGTTVFQTFLTNTVTDVLQVQVFS